MQDFEKKYNKYNTENFKELILRDKNTDLTLRKKIQKYNISKVDQEDLLQIARMGVTEAVDYYNPQKGPLKSFILSVVEKKLKTAIKHYNREKRKINLNTISLDAPVNSNNSDKTHMDFLFDDTTPSIENYLIQKEDKQRIKKTLNNLLTTIEKKVVIMIINGYKPQEISNHLQVSPKMVDNARERAKRKLKNCCDFRVNITG